MTTKGHPVDFEHWQKRWDAQQTSYLPDREQRFEAMLDVVEAARGSQPGILDLAGGTGSITRRALERFPAATSVVVDADPALLAIAAGTFRGDPRVEVVSANLADPAWRTKLPARPFDAVLTATALHWLPPERVAVLYAEVRQLLRSGGVLGNADHMPDDGLEPLVNGFASIRQGRAEKIRDALGATDWNGWWDELAQEPGMASLVAERNEVFKDRISHTQSERPSSWHVEAMLRGGFRHAGLAWRGLEDALVVGLAG